MILCGLWLFLRRAFFIPDIMFDVLSSAYVSAGLDQDMFTNQRLFSKQRKLYGSWR
jgi:hypothetical protein